MLKHRPLSQKQRLVVSFTQTHKKPRTQLNQNLIDQGHKKNMPIRTGKKNHNEEKLHPLDLVAHQR